MADHLNMGGLSLKESQHAGGPQMGNGPSTYIPPHLRSRGQNNISALSEHISDVGLGGPPAAPQAEPQGGPPGVASSAWGPRPYVIELMSTRNMN